MVPLANTPRRLPWFAMALAVLVITIGSILVAQSILRFGRPTVYQGRLDLRAWDFRQGDVDLTGSWEFLEELLASSGDFSPSSPAYRHVPDTRMARGHRFLSGTGGGTYRLMVWLPPEGEPLGLRMATVWSAYEVVANGQILARVGNPSQDPTREIPAIGPGVIPLQANGENLELLIRVSNHQVRWGGIVNPPVLGLRSELLKNRSADERKVLFWSGLLAGTALFALLFFLFYRHDVAFLAFSVFTLLVIIRMITTGDQWLVQTFPAIGFEAYLRIQHLSLYLLLPSATVFFATLFRQILGKTELQIFLTLALLPLPFIPWAPLLTLSWSLFGYFFVSIGLILYAYWAVCVRLVLWNRPEGSLVLLFGSALLGVLLVNFANEVLQATAANSFPWASSVFILIQAAVLAYRSRRLTLMTKRLSSELQRTNRALVVEARQAHDARERAEHALAEKEVLLQEVHHRVKNSLQIVLSTISMESRRTPNRAVQAAYQAVRDRILAISLVHERLYGLESEQRLNLFSYLEDLVSHLNEGLDAQPVQLLHSNAPLGVPMDFCLDVGLITTELVMNSTHHKTGPHGPIRIELRTDDHNLHLSVLIDSVGDPQDLLLESSSTAGYKIVTSLVTSRRGRCEWHSRPGARIDVVLPLDRSSQ